MPDRPNFPIPAVINPPRVCLQIEVPGTDDHKRVIAGLFWELTQWFNWQRDSDHSGTQLAEVYREVFNSIDWSNMSCCPDVTTLTRITSDGGLEVSTDGGAHWTPDPLDPRTTAPSFPPVTPVEGVETTCLAAANAQNQINLAVVSIAGLLDTFITLVTLSTAILAIIAALIVDPGDISRLLPVIFAEAGYLFGVTESEYTATFTDAVKRKLFCILQAHVESDGSYTISDLAAIKADIESQFAAEPIPKNTYLLLLTCIGVIGLNTITTIPGGDTSDCTCAACDLTLWVEINGNPITRPDDGTIEVDGYTLGGGDAHYYAGIQAPTNTGNSHEIAVDLVSGSVSRSGDARYWSVDGEGVVTTHSSPFFGSGTTCYRTLYYSSDFPFRLRFTCFVDCP